MSFAKAYSGLKSRRYAALLVAACGAVPWPAAIPCRRSTRSTRARPTSRRSSRRSGRDALQRGLARIQKRRLRGRGQEVRRPRKAAPLFGMVAQSADHDGLRELRGRPYEESITAASAISSSIRRRPEAAYAQYLMASSHYDQIPDITRDQEKTERALSPCRSSSHRYPTVGIRGRRQAEDPGRPRPARRQGDGSRPLLSAEAQLLRRDQPLPHGGRRATRRPATSRRRSSA